ncbi:TPA: hypothetical protein QDB45_005282 [Burkholderia vietnamiensis]|nr:hypothetical protein [Burkholderia vietnamiensis]
MARKGDEGRIPDALLLSALGNKELLHDDLWLSPAQAGMVMGRSARMLEDDRKNGTSPPFIKRGGANGPVRYRLGDVRNFMKSAKTFTSNLEMHAALSFGEFLDTAGPTDRWPFLLHQGTPIDFFKSLTLGDAITDEDTAVVLTLDDYLTKRKEAAWAKQAARERDDVTAFADAETPQDLPSLKDVKPNGGRL